MSKSKEELETLKKEIESVTNKCRELTPEELEQVTGGSVVLPGTHDSSKSYAGVTMRSREPGGGYVTATEIHGVEFEGAIPPCR